MTTGAPTTPAALLLAGWAGLNGVASRPSFSSPVPSDVTSTASSASSTPGSRTPAIRLIFYRAFGLRSAERLIATLLSVLLQHSFGPD